ncbi:cadherin-4-like [Neoarius graeffei]|uniref:cadherin-4-like n=1 Tax=Neoarius graeffei TaxID=443677 RepID=UPI00298CCFF8|nr:cadherin-4-like [Neoarius graeffei]
MTVGLLLPLAAALVLTSSPDTAGSLTGDRCRLGFSQNFYTVFIPQEQLQGHAIVKGSVLSSGRVKFEACHLNDWISFKSSDPKFSIRPDGSLYAEQDVTNLSEPVRFVVTAQGSKRTRIWKTIVQLVINRHPRPPLINQIVDKASSHHNCYDKLSQHHRGVSSSGLPWQKRDCIIQPISAPENSRSAFPLFRARVSDRWHLHPLYYKQHLLFGTFWNGFSS